MTRDDLALLLTEDRKRQGAASPLALLRDPAYRFTVGLRLASYARANRQQILSVVLRVWLGRQKWRYGFDISPNTSIGGGLVLAGHPGGIIINEYARIGRNCSISHGVTLGRANRGRNAGTPTLGDGVYLGPGAKIVGAVTIGHDVAIGANAVVTCDIPDHSVAVGIPAKVVSQGGSDAYIANAA